MRADGAVPLRRYIAAILVIIAAASCSPMVHVTTVRDGSDSVALPIDVGLRLRADAVEVALTNRAEMPVDVLWDKASLVDLKGNSSGVVHSTATEWAAPDVAGDVSRIAPHGTLHVFLVPVRDVIFEDNGAGWYVDPLLPVECGPLRCLGYHELVGQTVRLTLPIQLNGSEQVLDWTLRITDAEKSFRGGRPEQPALY